jgi:hypothetical protein
LGTFLLKDVDEEKFINFRKYTVKHLSDGTVHKIKMLPPSKYSKTKSDIKK